MVTIQYEEKTGTLWIKTSYGRFFLCQESGELKPLPGRDISDYYWSGHADKVKAMFRSMDGLELPILEAKDE